MYKGDNYEIRFSSEQLAYYRQVIRVFTKQIDNGHSNDYAIRNSRGECLLNLGLAEKDSKLIHAAIKDFSTVVRNDDSIDDSARTVAQENLSLAERALERLREDRGSRGQRDTARG